MRLKGGYDMKKVIGAIILICLAAVCLAGCQKKNETVSDKKGIEEFIMSAEAQSKIIKNSLEKDELTQNEMNLKSGELSELWDAAMKQMLKEAEKMLDAEAAEKLYREQEAWEEKRVQRIQDAGSGYEDGSIQALIVNMENARLLEERAYELYELIK